jgi:hypothetical protein
VTSKKRKNLQKARNILRTSRNQHLSYGKAVADALRRELQSNHAPAKTLRRWTGAGSRTVTNWLGGVRGPSGQHLVSLIGKSDEVFRTVLRLAKRLPTSEQNELGTARMHAAELLKLLESGLTGLSDHLPPATTPLVQAAHLSSTFEASAATKSESGANDSHSVRG